MNLDRSGVPGPVGAELVRPAWFTGPSGVPYVPTLGPVHPGEDATRLIRDVFSAAGTGQALPYDKDARWSTLKDEHIIDGTMATSAFHQPSQPGEPGGGIIIPTLSERPHTRITLYCYGAPEPAAIQGLAADLHAEHPDTPVHQVMLRSGATESIGGGAHAVRIWMHDFTDTTGTHEPPVPRPGVYVLSECFGPLVHSFADFAARLHADGWVFVRDQLRERDLGPILIRVHERRVVAASGPLQISADARGRPRLLPQYLSVLPEARGHGFGEDLRHAVTSWARQHGAEYELLQTVIGGPANRLHARLGARRLGTRHHQLLEQPATP